MKATPNPSYDADQPAASTQGNAEHFGSQPFQSKLDPHGVEPSPCYDEHRVTNEKVARPLDNDTEVDKIIAMSMIDEMRAHMIHIRKCRLENLPGKAATTLPQVHKATQEFLEPRHVLRQVHPRAL